MSPEEIETHVRKLAREELGVEPTDAEVARGCAVIAAFAVNAAGTALLVEALMNMPRRTAHP